MTTGVGLYVGETQSVAVVTTPGAALRTVERATVLTPTADGGVELGTHGKDSVEGFVEMVGATEGIKYAGADTRAEDLIATAMFCLFRDIAGDLHGDVDVVAAHPSGWSEEATRALRESLDYMGLQHAKLISAEDAVAASTESYATDDEAGSAVSDSRPGWAAAHGGALMASGMKLSRNAQPFDTDSFPAVPREQPIAYSQAIVVPASEHFVAADIGPALPPAAEKAVTTAKAEPPASRRPLLLAGAAAGVLTVIGIAAALTIGYTGSTDAPPIRDATQAEATSPTKTRNAPVTFPTVKPQEATHETPVRTVADPLPVVVEEPVIEAPPVEIPTAEPPTSDPVESPSPTTEEPTETTPEETTTPPDTTTPTDTTDPEDPEGPEDSESPEPSGENEENPVD